MKNIKKLDENAIEILDYEIKVRTKTRPKKGTPVDRKAILKKIRQTVIDSYVDYEKLGGKLEEIKNITLSLDEQEALKYCYTSRSKKFDVIYKKIKKIVPADRANRCPYCDISEATTVDHYLPKDEFPQYSFFPPNLIPCCWECNHNKGENWSTKKRTRLFIHLYYDTIPFKRILFAKINHLDFSAFKLPSIKPKGNKKSVAHLFLNNDMARVDDYMYKILRNHFAVLKLYERYLQCISEPIEELIDNINNTIDDFSEACDYDLDASTLRKVIIRQLQKKIDRKGYYHWKYSIQLSLLEEDDLLTYFLKIYTFNKVFKGIVM
jgi:5-methylcytosine-specific restriction endonuclease McrA